MNRPTSQQAVGGIAHNDAGQSRQSSKIPCVIGSLLPYHNLHPVVAQKEKFMHFVEKFVQSVQVLSGFVEAG